MHQTDLVFDLNMRFIILSQQ